MVAGSCRVLRVSGLVSMRVCVCVCVCVSARVSSVFLSVPLRIPIRVSLSLSLSVFLCTYAECVECEYVCMRVYENVCACIRAGRVCCIVRVQP